MFSKITKITTLLVGTMFLSSCGTLSKSECLQADWRLIGYEDGSKGFTANRVGEHRKSCADHGITPNLGAYQSGWNEGIKIFCQPNNGYKVGLRGYSYNNVCPANLEGAFLQAYSAGYEIYKVRSRYNNNLKEQNRIRNELVNIDQSIADREHLMRYGRISRHERNVLYDEIKQLSTDKGALEVDLRNLQDEAIHLQRDLDDLTRSSRY